MKNFILLVFLFSAVQTSSQSFQLTVANGYGSGTFNAGDTVDIWSGTIPANSVFDNWTGDVSFLESTDEWHTTLIMPSQNVSVVANFKNIGAYTIHHESIMGRDTLKEVYSYFPPNFKGVIFCFHGTGGNAGNWVNLYDYKQFLNDAVADSFAFIVTEAEEVTRQTDFDSDGKLRWAYVPYDTTTNVDLINIRTLIDTFRLRGNINSTTKFYAVGMSNGGAFSQVIATIYNWRAAVSYCAQQSQLLMNTTNTPIQWCMAKYDNHPQVGPAGNAAALVNSQTLQSRGICTRYFSHDHSPVYPERFMRSGTITQTKANNLMAEFQNNHLLDTNNYLLYASDSIGAKIAAAPASYLTFLSLTGTEKIFVATQVDAMYAAHQFYSDYNNKTLRFFDSLCDTAAMPTLVEEMGNMPSEIRLYPNPAKEAMTIAVDAIFIGEEFIVADLSGRVLLKERITSSSTHLNTSNLSAGMYLLMVKNTMKKFVKE